MSVSSLDNVAVRRCHHCGVRFTSGSTPQELVRICDTCGLPYRAPVSDGREEASCTDCEADRNPGALHDAGLAAATEIEVRAALEDHLDCVSTPSISSYLRKMLGAVARRMPEAPAGGRVVLVRHDSLETLALPSGTLLVSVGMLSAVADEAELAFVLGHEVGHVASGDASARIVRLGIRSLTRRGEAAGDEAWAEAAMDLVRMGYGRKHEVDADRRAIEAMLEMGYDPRSSIGFLERLQARIDAGDPLLQEYALAHPAPSERIREIERQLFALADGAPRTRVNREVFRRAAGESAIAALEPVEGFGVDPDSEEALRRAQRRELMTWSGGLLLLVTLISALAWLLLR